MKTILTTSVLVFALTLSARAAEPIAVASAAGTSSATAAKESIAKPWPQENSDLKADSNAIWGKLDNGLRYVIYPTKALPTRASLRLYMDVGSLMESENQRGLAHFLEHLAFCGTKHFAAGETVEYFQRLGMHFGADTNASTTFDQTIYKLELPRASAELTGEGMKFLRDLLDGMLLEPKEIDRERGVILSEIRARDSAEARAGFAGVQFLMPEILDSQRQVLGSVASVKALAPKNFHEFYNKWYTPRRATVVAVGDFDATMVERLISQNFCDAQARNGEQLEAATGKLAEGQGVSARLFSSPDLQTVLVRLNIVHPAPAGPETARRDRQEIARAMANLMLNVRLKKIVAAENSPIQAANGSYERFLTTEIGSVSAACTPEKWKATLGVVEQELRRALIHGFTETEFKDVEQHLGMIYQAIADQAETRQPASLADRMIGSLGENNVFTHPADDLAMLKSMLADMTKEDCLQALREVWGGGELKIWVQGNLALTGDGSQEILDAFRASSQNAVSAPVEESAAQWVYTDFGAAGTIVKRTHEKDLDIEQIVFANHVHVNIKHTDFEKGKVRMVVRFGGGLLEMPVDKLGLDRLAGATFISGGLRAYSIEQINRFLADKNTAVMFGVADDAFMLGGFCSPAALETQLQVCAAYLTAPAFREEAHQQFLQGADGVYAEIEHTAAGAETTQLRSFLRSGEQRFKMPAREEIQKLTMEDLKVWLAKPLAKGFMEVTLVGDVDADQALPLLAKTLGALPEREAVKPALAKERELKFPVGAKHKEISFSSETPTAISAVCWPTTGCRDQARDHRTRILDEILLDRIRLKVRAELGATYTPSVFRFSDDAFPDFGWVQAEMTVDPALAAEIGPRVAAIGSELAKGKIGDDEFDRATKPVLASLEEAAKDNGYWVNALSNCQERPAVLDEMRSEVADYQSIIKAEVESLAKELFTADKALIISVTPTAAK